MSSEPRRILVTGHDLKFIRPLISRLSSSPDYEVKLDEHADHGMTDEGVAKTLLGWADTVFCEWAMGNAVWFSRRKRPGQTLVVRLHLQEVQARLSYLWQIDWQAVDHLVCICHHTYDWLCAEFPILRTKAIIVYNPIDAATALSLPKMPHSEFNLGFVGMVPHRKRLDIAFDIFAALRDIDSRYTLHVKGRRPDDYPWMRKRQDELDWYQTLEAKIESSPHRNAVVYDPQGPDMPEWYSAMGFILSTSDFEGSHQAIAEGMAAGCIPVIRNWEGADRIYPGRFQFESVEEAVEKVRGWHTPETFMDTAQACRKFAVAHFDSGLILDKLERLVAGGIDHRSQLPKQSKAGNPGIAVLGYLPPGTRNGYRIRIEQELKQLGGVTDNLTLIVLHPPASRDEMTAHEAELSALGCRVRPVEITEFFDMDLTDDRVLPAIATIERILAEDDVGILHAEALYCMRVAAMLAPRCTNLRILFDDHGISPEEEAMNGAHVNRIKAVEELERNALVSADLSIFVSNRMATHYASKYNLPSLPHLILPCCVERKFFFEEPLLQGVDLPADRLVLGYAGTLAVWQCGEEMLALFARLHARDPSLFFLLLAPAREHDSAHAAVAAAGIPEDAILIAEVAHDRIPGCLSRVDVGLLLRRDHPVNRVASPTKFAEYLASGVPVLMTDGIGDYSAESETANLGLVVPEDELLTEEIEPRVLERIEAFLGDVRDHRQTWSHRCREYARTNLAWESCMPRLYEYLEIGKGTKKPRYNDEWENHEMTNERKQVVQAKALEPRHVQNAQIMPSRHHVLDELPKGLVWGEVGVAFGDYSQSVLARAKPGVFHAIDLFDLEKHEVIFGLKSAEVFEGKTHEGFFRDRFAKDIVDGTMKIDKGLSTEVLSRFDDEYFDVLYVDAAHDYTNVKKDLNVAKHKVKRDGLLMMNDYVMSNPFDGQLYGVVQATNELCVEEDWEIIYMALHPYMFCDVVIRRITT